MPAESHNKQSLAQCAYMNYLAQLVTPQNQDDLATLPIDTQGRILVDIRLREEQIAELMRIINEQTTSNYPLNNSGLEQALGKKVTTATTVSMDMFHNTHLENAFNERLAHHLAPLADAKRIKAILNALNEQPKSSIIALQQEFHFHLSLVARVYQKKMTAFKDKSSEMQNALRLAHQDLNSEIFKIFAQALVTATNANGVLDKVKLNKELDKARKSLMPISHTLLMKHIVEQTGVIVKKEDFEKTPSGADLKTLAEQTTATPNDVLHLDSAQGVATLIAGSDNTSHHRKKGYEFAHRQLITHALQNQIIKPNLNVRIQIRTPSPVMKEGLANNGEYVNDVGRKLDAISAEYQLAERLHNDQKPRAFIYNSYTAINDTLGDTGGNLQTQSARHILRGAHAFNAIQLRNPSKPPVLCFVQNISVNGFGDSLGYGQNDALITESTLMTEMALLHTLFATLPASRADTINAVWARYKQYLTKTPREQFFSQSREGRNTIKLMQSIKNDCKQYSPANNSSDLIEHAKLSLRHLMAHDLHFTHDYAKLVQTLSVFVEAASLGGCKSGNERAQCINGRVAILDSLLNSQVPNDKKELRDALAGLAKGGSMILSAAQALKKALDKEYNHAGLHSAASIISLVDQGAPAKVESKPGHPFYVSRNYAEEPSSVISYLHQTKAGSMQAHKDLTTHMKNAWDGNPRSWWARMQSSPLGIFGAIVGVITVLPALGVALYSAYDNAQRKRATHHTNYELLKVTIDDPSNEAEFASSPEKMLGSLSNPDFSASELLINMQSTRPSHSGSVTLTGTPHVTPSDDLATDPHDAADSPKPN